MSPPAIRVRGIRTPLPSGYILGRVSPGVGDTELIDVSTLGHSLVATGVVGSGGGTSPGVLTPIANDRVLGNTSGAAATPTAQALTAPAAGMTITGGSNAFTFAFTNDLGALEALATTGIAARTATSTWTAS